MNSTSSVTELNHKIKALLETTFLSVSVVGEVSRVTYHSSGHLYFTLKDENSSISCVMFRGNNQKLKFQVKDGMKVVVSGGISVYAPRGSYQINCTNMEPSGEGALNLAFKQLKEKLEKKGYFDPSVKKVLPKYPKHIVLVTSGTGAALQDMLRVSTSRWPMIKLTLVNTLVQGQGAAENIAQNIKIADSLEADIVVVGRGGGSVEDLWSFNEEIVADAIFEASTPMVSAVGHEIDVLISDLCADLRAPTPSAAMELILPDQNEILQYIDTLIDQYNYNIQNLLHKQETTLQNLYSLFDQNSFNTKMNLYKEEIEVLFSRISNSLMDKINFNANHVDLLKSELNSKIKQLLFNKERSLELIQNSYKSFDPKNKIGIALVEKDGKKLSLDKLDIDDVFDLMDASSTIKAKVLECN